MRTTIPAIVILAEPQRAAVERLARHCLDLDGTRIAVIDGGPGTKLPYPACNTAALHQAAEVCKHTPFVWLEPDSIPLKPNWLQTLTDEFKKSGKEFMLSSDSNPPHDLIGGIGVYGRNTHWFIPKNFSRDAWDLWLFHHARELVHWTPLIQHSYGNYTSGRPIPHRFPQDASLIREDAVIFHRDKFQDLIKQSEPEDEDEAPEIVGPVFRHPGDLGDIIAALPGIRQLGGGSIICCDSATPTPGLCGRESLKGARFRAIEPLLKAQPYIAKVAWTNCLSGSEEAAVAFRKTMRPGESLAHSQARAMGIPPENLDTSPWLHLSAPAVPSGRVIVARSPRYHNPLWDAVWPEVARAYGDLLLFIGLPSEHSAFQSVLKRTIEYAPTNNLLEAAQLIASSTMVYANQSCPAWLALGLGKRHIQETDPARPNTRILYSGAAFVAEHTQVADLIGSLRQLKNGERA